MLQIILLIAVMAGLSMVYVLFCFGYSVWRFGNRFQCVYIKKKKNTNTLYNFVFIGVILPHSSWISRTLFFFQTTIYFFNCLVYIGFLNKNTLPYQTIDRKLKIYFISILNPNYFIRVTIILIEYNYFA